MLAKIYTRAADKNSRIKIIAKTIFQLHSLDAELAASNSSFHDTVDMCLGEELPGPSQSQTITPAPAVLGVETAERCLKESVHIQPFNMGFWLRQWFASLCCKKRYSKTCMVQQALSPKIELFNF